MILIIIEILHSILITERAIYLQKNPKPILNFIEKENSLAPLEKKMLLNEFVCLLRYCFDENLLRYKNRTIIHDKTFSFSLFDITSH